MSEVELRYIWVLLVCMALSLGGSTVFAQEKSSTTATLIISAGIREILDLDAAVFRVDADKFAFEDDSNTTDVDDIDFGKLGGKDKSGIWKEGCLDKDYGIWLSQYYFVVLLFPDTSGRPYEISQEFIAAGGNNPLRESLIMTPGYCSEDKWFWWEEETQGDMPPGDNLGENGCEVTDGCGVSAECARLAEGQKRIYESNSGEARIIRGYYGLATGKQGEPAGAKILTADSPAGDWMGQIVFTITLK